MKTFKIANKNLIEINYKSTSLFNEENIVSIVSPDELTAMMDADKISKYILNECYNNNNHHLRIDHHQDYIYGILSSIELNKNKPESIDFNFFLNNNSLTIINMTKNKVLDKFIADVTDEEFMKVYDIVTPQVLLCHLINEIIECNEYYIDKIEDDLEKLEEKILNNAKKEYSKEIVTKRRLVMHLKHKIESFPCLTKTLLDNEYGIFDEKQLKTINILDYKSAKMVDNTNLLRDYASQVREAFEAERDIKTNDLMKVFTIVTSIFLPLTLIAGWYGMNFTTMPELTWDYGYVYVITLSLIVIIGFLIFFKKKKILK